MVSPRVNPLGMRTSPLGMRIRPIVQRASMSNWTICKISFLDHFFCVFLKAKFKWGKKLCLSGGRSFVRINLASVEMKRCLENRNTFHFSSFYRWHQTTIPISEYESYQVKSEPERPPWQWINDFLACLWIDVASVLVNMNYKVHQQFAKSQMVNTN